jgi:predicted secreted protein
MRLTSAIAIYFIIWWLVLFLVLPWGIRNPHEAGEQVEAGHEPGAPVDPQLGRKAILTTVVATVVFALVYAIIVQNWITLDDLRF